MEELNEFRQRVAKLWQQDPDISIRRVSNELKVPKTNAERALAWVKKNCSKPNQPRFDPKDPIVRSDTIKLLSKNKRIGVSLATLATRLNTNLENVKKVLEVVAQQDGYNLTEDFGLWKITDVLPPVQPLTISKLSGKEISFGLVSDTHLCNEHSRLDILEAAYDTFQKAGIKEVYHAGNIIDGEFKFNRYELLAHGVHEQANYLADHYPQREGITTYFISGACYDNQTEVMTREKGFVLFSELTGEEELATLDLETNLWVWQKPISLIIKPFDGELYHFQGDRFDQKVTPDHRMIFHKRFSSEKYTCCEAQEFPKKGEKQFFAGCGWEGPCPETIKIPVVQSSHPWTVKSWLTEFPAETFMKFLGWFVSEGCLGDCTDIHVCQKVGPKLEDLIQIVKELGYSPKITVGERNIADVKFSSLHLSHYLRKLGKSFQKYVPDEIKSLGKPLLLAFLKAYWAGDGSYDFDHGYASTTSKRLASDIVEMGMKCGYAARFTEYPPGVGKILGEEIKHNHPEFVIFFNKMRNPWYVKTPKKEYYKGTVYCAQVPNGTLLVRRDGKTSWGSNCHEGWFQADAGLRIGWYLQNWCEERGRKDLVHIGHMEQDVIFKRPHGEMRMRIMHPGGGTPYATSYPSQKMVESFQGGDKPHVLVIGHYHKFDVSYPREVLTIMPGCTEDQTSFMRKLKIRAEVGFCVCNLGIRSDGTLGHYGVDWHPFYDAAYHKKLEGLPLIRE